MSIEIIAAEDLLICVIAFAASLCGLRLMPVPKIASITKTFLFMRGSSFSEEISLMDVVEMFWRRFLLIRKSLVGYFPRGIIKTFYA